jgi:hypothetical protein
MEARRAAPGDTGSSHWRWYRRKAESCGIVALAVADGLDPAAKTPAPEVPTSVPFHPDAAIVKRDVLQPIALLAGDILCETRVIETVAADQAPIFVDAARDVEFGTLLSTRPIGRENDVPGIV